jgi:gamma-glutamylcyclotransferase (GGCT)/AIG2-like uncharacterized protein YtfP
MSDYLFIYGTLSPHRAPAEVSSAVGKLRKVGKGQVRGRLYDLGEYPGAILDASAATVISGEVFALPGASILATLDSYEGFNPTRPKHSLFLRKRYPVLLSDGRELECWVYVYNRDPGSAPLVADGDYEKHKAA